MKTLSVLSIIVLSACSSPPGPVVPETKVERQMIGLLQKFDRWDLDGDGQLTARELAEASQISGESPATIIEFYDTNGDDKISLKEAQKGYARADEAEKIVTE